MLDRRGEEESQVDGFYTPKISPSGSRALRSRSDKYCSAVKPESQTSRMGRAV